jgi:hypothetical protein
MGPNKGIMCREGQTSYLDHWGHLMPKYYAQFFRRIPKARWRETMRAQLLG